MSTSAAQTPAVGDPVFFEGLPHKITSVSGNLVEFASDLTHTGPDNNNNIVTVPRFRTGANLSDFQWSDELKSWYLWGRVLCKGRGGVGMDQRAVVAELRDRGLIPSRPGRERGAAPAGGEQLDLHIALFYNQTNWKQEMANVRRGEGLSTQAEKHCVEFHKRAKRRIVEGFAAPGDGDPHFKGEA
jgi:hypothetical protein